jgi:hypothetical protein
MLQQACMLNTQSQVLLASYAAALLLTVCTLRYILDGYLWLYAAGVLGLQDRHTQAVSQAAGQHYRVV